MSLLLPLYVSSHSNTLDTIHHNRETQHKYAIVHRWTALIRCMNAEHNFSADPLTQNPKQFHPPRPSQPRNKHSSDDLLISNTFKKKRMFFWTANSVFLKLKLQNYKQRLTFLTCALGKWKHWLKCPSKKCLEELFLAAVFVQHCTEWNLKSEKTFSQDLP